jgi:hypothetical protein
MYDVIAEIFVYVFALIYAVLFVILAQKWLRSVTARKRKKRPKSAMRSGG